MKNLHKSVVYKACQLFDEVNNVEIRQVAVFNANSLK